MQERCRGASQKKDSNRTAIRKDPPIKRHKNLVGYKRERERERERCIEKNRDRKDGGG